WGLAFKPRTDDMREAPAIVIIERLLQMGAAVRAYDPEANETARCLFGDRITLCDKAYDALKDADALVVVTEWNNFREPDFETVREPAKYYLNIVVGALTVLNAMAATGVKRLVFSSTCATYGEPAETPITETHPQLPINSYGESKLAVERALPHYERAHGIRAVAMRYFNAAGADPDGEIGEDHSPEIHVIPRAIEAATGGPGLTVFGDDYPTPDGTCLRDYIHVADLADAHVKALEAIVETAKSSAYNLGT